MFILSRTFVTEYVPVRQGLKLIKKAPGFVPVTEVTEYVPVRQGLKLIIV